MPAEPTFREDEIPLEKLILDPNNYRFQDEPGFVLADEGRFRETTVQDRAYRRIRSEGVAELKASILANGFLTLERLVVRAYLETDAYLVVEGNRRLAALRWIKEDWDAGVEIREDVLRVLDAVPVVVIESEAESAYLAIMGVRHVGGIKEWGGYQRAKLVSTLRDDFNLDTSEVAARLGMSPQEVNRRYRAFKALEQMRSDDEFGEFAESTLYPIFHEAISIPLVRDWLGWDESSAQFTSSEELRSFYELLTPTDEVSDESGAVARPAKLPTYLQVRDLRVILPNPEAKRILLDSERDFGEALGIAKADELNRSWKSQVAEAAAVLSAISALELSKTPREDIDAVVRLQTLAGELVANYQKLTVD